MASITVSIWVTLVLAILGFFIYMWSTNSAFKAACAELGKALLWTGLLATLLALSGKVLHC